MLTGIVTDILKYGNAIMFMRHCSQFTHIMDVYDKHITWIRLHQSGENIRFWFEMQ